MGGVNVVEWEVTDGPRLRLASLAITARCNQLSRVRCRGNWWNLRGILEKKLPSHVLK